MDCGGWDSHFSLYMSWGFECFVQCMLVYLRTLISPSRAFSCYAGSGSTNLQISFTKRSAVTAANRLGMRYRYRGSTGD